MNGCPMGNGNEDGLPRQSTYRDGELVEPTDSASFERVDGLASRTANVAGDDRQFLQF